MTADSFIDYLEHPAHLYQVSYQELKSLVVQYPYCQNLRYLLLKKSQLENHRDLNRNLSLAATYAADRKRLFELSQQEIESKQEIEFLDLQELEQKPEKEAILANESSFDFVVEANSSTGDIPLVLMNTTVDNGISLEVQEETPVEEEVVFELPLIDSFSAFDSLDDTDLELAPILEQETLAAKSPLMDSFGANQWFSERLNINATTSSEIDEIDAEIAAAMERLAAQQNIEAPELSLRKTKVLDNEEANILLPNEDKDSLIRPEPKVSFNSWLSQFKAPVQRGEGKGYNVLLTPLEFESPVEKRKEKKKAKKKPKKGKKQLLQMLETKQKALEKRHKKKKKKNRIVAKAVMSLVESEDLASETLANILVEQERFKKAIKMYKRLSLKIPEKNAYFAAKIEKIKKLM